MSYNSSKGGMINATSAPTSAPIKEINCCTFGIAMAIMYVVTTKKILNLIEEEAATVSSLKFKFVSSELVSVFGFNS